MPLIRYRSNRIFLHGFPCSCYFADKYKNGVGCYEKKRRERVMSEKKKALTVVDQRKVEFYGDVLTAVKASDGQIYVPIRHVIDPLWLNSSSQMNRIRKTPDLIDGCFKGYIQTARGRRPANCMRIELIPEMLAGVNASQIEEEIVANLQRCQKEIVDILKSVYADDVELRED